MLFYSEIEFFFSLRKALRETSNYEKIFQHTFLVTPSVVAEGNHISPFNENNSFVFTLLKDKHVE